jgi:hypothetical protein
MKLQQVWLCEVTYAKQTGRGELAAGTFSGRVNDTAILVPPFNMRPAADQ